MQEITPFLGYSGKVEEARRARGVAPNRMTLEAGALRRSRRSEPSG